MKTFYSNILVPIDFGNETEALIRTAIAVAHPGNSIIHLVHIEKQNPLLFWKYWRGKTPVDYFSSIREAHHFVRTMLKLLHWKNWVDNNHQDVGVCVHVRRGKDQLRMVADLAKHLESELIILPKESKRFFFSIAGSISPRNLAKQTKCEVLSLDQGIYFSYVRKDLLSSASPSNDLCRNGKGIKSQGLFERAYYGFSCN